MTIHRTIGAATAVVLCAVALTGAASAASYPPAAMKAMGERYEAMANHYFGDSATRYSPQALRSLGERWEAAA